MIAMATADEPAQHRWALEPAHVTQALIRELALGAKTQAKLAGEYGVTQSAITRFKQKYKRRIAEVREDLDDEFAGLWSANKANRIAHYERQVEQLDEQITRALNGQLDRTAILAALSNGGFVEDLPESFDVSEILARLTKAKDRALRSIAEELGQLPSRVQVNVGAGTTATLKLEGVDIDKL